MAHQIITALFLASLGAAVKKTPCAGAHVLNESEGR